MKILKTIYFKITVSLIILSGLFYWYEVRPSLILSICGDKASLSALAGNNDYLTSNNTSETIVRYNHFFEVCLHEHGFLK